MEFQITKHYAKDSKSNSDHIERLEAVATNMPVGTAQCLYHALLLLGKRGAPTVHGSKIEHYPIDGEHKFTFTIDNGKLSAIAQIPCAHISFIKTVEEFFDALAAKMDELLPLYQWATHQFTDVQKKTDLAFKQMDNHAVSTDEHGAGAVDRAVPAGRLLRSDGCQCSERYVQAR